MFRNVLIALVSVLFFDRKKGKMEKHRICRSQLMDAKAFPKSCSIGSW